MSVYRINYIVIDIDICASDLFAASYKQSKESLGKLSYLC